MGYRLTGPTPVDRLCVRHLNDAMRAVVAFEDTTATVLLVAPHDTKDPERDVYTQLWRLCGLDAPPEGKRTKPACCGSNGLPPEATDLVEDLISECDRTIRRGSRR